MSKVPRLTKACDANTHDPETLFLAVVYLDSFAEQETLPRWKQLFALSAACVFVAAKLTQELNEPRPADIIDHINLDNNPKYECSAVDLRVRVFHLENGEAALQKLEMAVYIPYSARNH